MTPVRDEGLIAAAQATQYRHRVNYIPSVHELADPSLIVNDAGQAWILYAGKWYNAEWNLPIEVWAAYQDLNEERNRRLETSQSEFIEARKQARFLWQRSWWQVAQSLAITIGVMAEIIASKTRRKPPKEPPKGYGQWRGGGQIISIVIYNPFLEEEGEYKVSNGKQILAQATAQNKSRFYKDVNDKISRLISTARKLA